MTNNMKTILLIFILCIVQLHQVVLADWRTEKPVFDPVYYADTYNDLFNAFGYDAQKLKAHWLAYGIKEGRKSSPVFDVRFYLSTHTDLQIAFPNGATNYAMALEHWKNHGIKEGRRSSQTFDVKCYLGKYRDLQIAFGKRNYKAAINHYLAHGRREGRTTMCSP